MLYSVITVDLMLLVFSGSVCLVQSAARMLSEALGSGECGVQSAGTPRGPGTHALLEHRNCCSAKLQFLDDWLATRVPRDLKLGISRVSGPVCSV